MLSLAVCCGLAWWQWERFTSAGGSFQNLGYVLQWPLFGLFPAFMFWRLARLRRQAGSQSEPTAATREDAAPSHAPSEPTASEPVAAPSQRVEVKSPSPTPRARDDAPADWDDEDAALAEYNAYLAQLNAREQERN
jgi:DNA-binding transcriptional regulator of glucitol operon